MCYLYGVATMVFPKPLPSAFVPRKLICVQLGSNISCHVLFQVTLMEVSTGRFPYISMLEGRGRACSVVAITNRHILTAASCIFAPGNSAELMFGPWKGGASSWWTLIWQGLWREQVHVHPNWTGLAADGYDIAILTLAVPIHALPVVLADPTFRITSDSRIHAVWPQNVGRTQVGLQPANPEPLCRSPHVSTEATSCAQSIGTCGPQGSVLVLLDIPSAGVETLGSGSALDATLDSGPPNLDLLVGIYPQPSVAVHNNTTAMVAWIANIRAWIDKIVKRKSLL
ncbi:unnamed protein product [Ostreobium quekettii]|uniref:Peptidase S1 domain-containing protein n=1 Tax=Ostreobium quekettii TaxID=121088 RepID=A0A8S1IYH8_9CHLO|nr:unnamed protein product [Ostreobium quekettii]